MSSGRCRHAALIPCKTELRGPPCEVLPTSPTPVPMGFNPVDLLRQTSKVGHGTRAATISPSHLAHASIVLAVRQLCRPRSWAQPQGQFLKRTRQWCPVPICHRPRAMEHAYVHLQLSPGGPGSTPLPVAHGKLATNPAPRPTEMTSVSSALRESIPQTPSH